MPPSPPNPRPLAFALLPPSPLPSVQRPPPYPHGPHPCACAGVHSAILCVGVCMWVLPRVRGVGARRGSLSLCCVATRSTRRLRAASFRSMIAQDAAFFERYPSGMLSTRLATDATLVHAMTGPKYATRVPVQCARSGRLTRVLCSVLSGAACPAPAPRCTPPLHLGARGEGAMTGSRGRIVCSG